MAVNFPTSLDTLTNPTATDYLNSPSHSTQHANANDILEALEAKVGIDGSAVTTSHDYKLAAIPSGGQAREKFVGEVTAYPMKTAPSGWLICDGSAVLRSTYAALFAVLNPSIGTFTVTIATPAVVTLNGHGLETGDRVYFTTTGALPTGLTANTIYYVIKIDANTFNLATSFANAHVPTKIATSGTQSGTHTLRFSPYGLGDGSTTFNVPNLKGKAIVGLDVTQSEFDVLGDGAAVGEKTHLLTSAESGIVNHIHGVKIGGASGGSNHYKGNTAEGVTDDPNSGANACSTQGSGSYNASSAHNNIQPYQTMNYIIKT